MYVTALGKVMLSVHVQVLVAPVGHASTEVPPLLHAGEGAMAPAHVAKVQLFVAALLQLTLLLPQALRNKVDTASAAIFNAFTRNSEVLSWVRGMPEADDEGRVA